MGFGEAVNACFTKFATFSGRARRSEYWYFALFAFAASFVTGLIDIAIFGAADDGFRPLTIGLCLVTFLPNLAVTVRRLHDLDRSGWWMMMPAGIGFFGGLMAIESPMLGVAGILAAVISTFVLFGWMMKRGSFGANNYGEDPIDRYNAVFE